MCKNKKCAKYDKLYIFEKPLPLQIQICKKFYKFSKTKVERHLSKYLFKIFF